MNHSIAKTSSPETNFGPIFGSWPRGFSLIEICIALLVFSIVMGGMYSFLSQAWKAGSKSNSRQDLVSQANILMKRIQEDFRVAISAKMGNGVVTVQQRIDADIATVTYLWNKPNLVRKTLFKGQTTVHQFSDNMENFSVEKKPRPSIDENSSLTAADEQVVIRLDLAAWVPGNPKPVTHEQHAMATMRQVASAKYDPHWRNVRDMKGGFEMYGDLMKSLTQDSQLLIEDIGKTAEGLVKEAEATAKDAANSNLTNLKDAKNQLKGALTDIQKGKLDLQTSLTDMENNMKSMPTDIFQREAGRFGTWFGSKDDALKRVQTAFVDMKTVEDCNIDKLKAAADPFKLNSAFDSMLEAKKKALQNKVKMGNSEASMTALLGDVEKKLGSN